MPYSPNADALGGESRGTRTISSSSTQTSQGRARGRAGEDPGSDLRGLTHNKHRYGGRLHDLRGEPNLLKLEPRGNQMKRVAPCQDREIVVSVDNLLQSN